MHQLIKSFLQTETAEQWIKHHARKQNGRIDFKALRAHYSGEGNTSRRIADAERIRDTLHYKNERAMQFSAFLDKIQKMFNIYDEEGEPLIEQAKVRMLLSKVEHPQLKEAVGALRVRASMDGTTFTECANHLSAQVSELPDNLVNRKIAGTERGKTSPAVKRIRGGGANNASKRKGIKMPDGSIWTGFYSDWDQLSKEDRQTLIDTRVENKAKEGRKRQASEVTTKSKKLKDITSQVAELKRTLASLKAKQPAADDDDDESDAPNNAGDAFGGRNQKKKKKD